MTETAIVVIVPEAADVVGHWRRELTLDGANSMPAHITLLYPFTDTLQLSARRISEARAVFDKFPAFDCVLDSVAYFENEPRLLYLQPEPANVLRAMIAALVQRFPEHPPYGGAISEPIPHLTVAESHDREQLGGIERTLGTCLPIRFRVTFAALMERDPARGWRRHSQLPLSE